MIIRKNIISAAALSEIFFAGPPALRSQPKTNRKRSNRAKLLPGNDVGVVLEIGDDDPWRI
jgi:hypothetical protein